jgi:hypothetical protein
MDARLLLIKHVLAAIPVHQLLALDPPKWLFKAINKILRAFLWCNDEIAKGGKCLVKWGSVCRPTAFGGLGIPDIQARSIALRTRWVWQSWQSNDKPWINLPLPIDKQVTHLFNAAVEFKIGDGSKIRFWRDPWINGWSLEHMAPSLFQACTRKNLTVREALLNDRWLRHLK